MKKLKERIRKTSLKTRANTFLFGILAGAILIAPGLNGNLLWVGIGISVIVLVSVYCRLAFRCPHCDSYLGWRMESYRQCPNCTKELEHG